jgi:hypothetical protein
MRSTILVCGFVATLAGCATMGSADRTGARLPDGVTLLESEQDSCEGALHVADGARGSRDIVVRAGQNASFRVDRERIEWTCIGESSTNDDTINCPDDTSHVRISRPASGDDFLLECYG